MRITELPGQDTKACGWVDPGLGQYAGKAPLTVEIAAPASGQWEWDYGDGTQQTAPTGKHTYAKAGSYQITARQGQSVIRGWVNAQPTKAPRIAAVRLYDETHILVTFDEPVQVKDARITLQSGAAIKTCALDEDGTRLSIDLAGRLGANDGLNLAGIVDRAQVPNALADGIVEVVRPSWPSNRANLLLLWENARKPRFHFDPNSRSFEDFTTTSIRKAKPNRDGVLALEGGVMFAIGAGAGIAAECSAASRFTLQAVITPDNIYQGGPGDGRRIIGCIREGRDDRPNFLLGQEGGKLILLLSNKPASPATNKAGKVEDTGILQRVELCSLSSQTPNHIVISYEPGRLVCFLNGRQVKETDEVKGALAWATPDFQTGDELWRSR